MRTRRAHPARALCSALCRRNEDVEHPTVSDSVPVSASWPPVANRRRLLAVYLDYLIFGAVWALALWGLSKVFPTLAGLPFAVKIAGFLILEALLLRLVRWSPGNQLLGIRLRLSDEFLTSKQESFLSGALVVDPRLLRSEAWWTILFGVLAILNGVKTAVRWTMFTPPAPEFGIQLSPEASVVVYVVSGSLHCLVGAAALQMRWYVLPLSVGYYGLSSVSAFLSRDLWPAWIEAYTHARRSYQGMPVRPGEVEMLQSIAPMIAIFPLVLLIWALAVFLRVRARANAA